MLKPISWGRQGVPEPHLGGEVIGKGRTHSWSASGSQMPRTKGVEVTVTFTVAQQVAKGLGDRGDHENLRKHIRYI